MESSWCVELIFSSETSERGDEVVRINRASVEDELVKTNKTTVGGEMESKRYNKLILYSTTNKTGS